MNPVQDDLPGQDDLQRWHFNDFFSVIKEEKNHQQVFEHQNVTRRQDTPRKRVSTICERHPCRTSPTLATCCKAPLAISDAAVRQEDFCCSFGSTNLSYKIRFHHWIH